METPDTKSLPDNAYDTLKPGESYQPIVPASVALPEATRVSVWLGLLFCVIFTVAAAYSGLKVGQVMEAAIPIAILAIGVTRFVSKDPPLLQNVIMTTVGGVSASVVAGAIFTLPALYALGLQPHPLQTIFICLAGGCLGVLFLIPLRRYFVRETHGEYPFPEATAITEILVTGERGGTQARLLVQATIIAGIGVLLDQPILIVGAMVAGPEYNAIMGISLGIDKQETPPILQGALALLARVHGRDHHDVDLRPGDPLVRSHAPRILARTAPRLEPDRQPEPVFPDRRRPGRDRRRGVTDRSAGSRPHRRLHLRHDHPGSR